jgi:hypothetical protein
MAKKAKRETSGQEGRPPTDTVRIEADLARKASIIATVTGTSVSDLLSPVLRPFIEREFAKAVDKLAKEAKPDQPEK